MTRRSTPRTAGNRRLGDGRSHHLLDVKVRTVTARRQRRQQVGGFFWKSTLVVVLCTAGWVGVTTALDKFFLSNPEYTLRRLNLELDGVMTRDDAIEATGIREGENIFRIDLAAAERTLRAMPQVATVSIERRLPDGISVTLEARKPVAWIAPPEKDADPFDTDRSMLADSSGLLMKPRLIQPEFYHLPVIYGVQSDNIRDGEPLHNEDLRRALALLDDVVSTPESLLRIRSVNISKGYCIEVTSDRNARITFAPEDFPGQLARLRQLLEHCRDSGREIESVNLMVRRNTPVRFVMADPPQRESTVSLVQQAKGRRN
ncbi:MAG: cell division protein FtsQ/DivIB [Terrimicrobiaceae bacterium]